MDNRIMHPSVLWPNSAGDVEKRLPVGRVGSGMSSVQSDIISRYPASASGRGWLEEGVGRTVDLLA